ncbi:MAG: hypothetical protein BGO96_09635 [Micrococcales bacterium 73-15]|nr:MAG: hypothetical protein BGO96_09635 [Micrococcales bacterium 73-15]
MDPAWDAPTIVRGVWIDYENWAPDVYSLRGPVAHGPLTRDTRGRYRVTCDDGVRRRLTIQQLRGEA